MPVSRRRTILGSFRHGYPRDSLRVDSVRLGRVRSGQRVVLNDLCAGVGLGVLLPRIHRMLVS